MDTTDIFKVAIATVGVVQIVKNLIPKGNKTVWTLATVLVGAGMVAVNVFCPSIVMDGCIAVSGATVFYDTIYKSFEKIFKRGNDE